MIRNIGIAARAMKFISWRVIPCNTKRLKPIGGVIWAKLVEPQAGYARNKPRRKKQRKDVLENADACSIRSVGP